MKALMRDPKPDYRKAMEDGIRDWEAAQTSPVESPMPQKAMDDLTGRIMRKVRDAGIVIGIDDGTDYAHRKP